MKCPHCGCTQRVYNFSWKELGCSSCNAMISKYKWLVQADDARSKSGPPAPREALVIGCTVYVTSRLDDTWLSFYYMHEAKEVLVLKGSGNVGHSRDFMPLEQAMDNLDGYEENEEGWKVEVKS